MSNQLPESFNNMMKLFDPEQMSKLFDPEQMKQLFQPPPAMKMDFSTIMETNQQNYEAMLTANKSATAAYNDFYEKQMQIFQELMASAREVAESSQVTASAEAAQKQALIYQTATRKALENMTALAEETQKANEQAFRGVQQQVKEAIDGLKRV